MALLAGCAVGPGYEIVPTPGPTTKGPVSGDRDDISRALGVGLEAAEAALLTGSWDGETYTASFIVVENRDGVATATHLGDGTFALTAYVDPDGDQVAQERLLNAWARRLRQLHGVAWAPR
ncbi:MAG: hypothetical protein NCW75_13500 [Phycisphaera sp.]|nr:MAG: hypothetical protein NCW75_13500 [Phycisphaera sp.]